MRDVLCSTAWVEEHLEDPKVRIVEVDVDTRAWEDGHIPGAVAWNWQTQLCDQVRRDIVGREQLERLLGASGIENETTVILYGDNNNWFACWAFWQLAMHGHHRLRIMDGGRRAWIREGRPLARDLVQPAPRSYQAKEPSLSDRALLFETIDHARDAAAWSLVDVRSPDEYAGRVLCPPGLPETCQRGGHIPGAVNVPWSLNCREDGTFRPADELRELYRRVGVTPDRGVITYCRIGERSSLTWFVLKHLLGFPRVLNYDGSWTEWGNLVNAPVARGDAP